MAAVAEDAREQQLAWEAGQRRRVGIAAIVAAVLGLASPIWRLIALTDAPAPGFLPSLSQALEPGPVGGWRASGSPPTSSSTTTR